MSSAGASTTARTAPASFPKCNCANCDERTEDNAGEIGNGVSGARSAAGNEHLGSLKASAEKHQTKPGHDEQAPATKSDEGQYGQDAVGQHVDRLVPFVGDWILLARQQGQDNDRKQANEKCGPSVFANSGHQMLIPLAWRSSFDHAHRPTLPLLNISRHPPPIIAAPAMGDCGDLDECIAWFRRIPL